jgi:hypothetical protein
MHPVDEMHTASTANVVIIALVMVRLLGFAPQERRRSACYMQLKCPMDIGPQESPTTREQF